MTMELSGVSTVAVSSVVLPIAVSSIFVVPIVVARWPGRRLKR